jgi:hypothetical protein
MQISEVREIGSNSWTGGFVEALLNYTERPAEKPGFYTYEPPRPEPPGG